MEKSYIEQFERVKRYFIRFKQINDGRTLDQSSQNYEDDVYAFFQNCYHLKDWIKNDSCLKWGKDVESFINDSNDLSICADLCNALKHLILDKKPHSSEKPDFTGEHHIALKINEGSEIKEISIKYKISTLSGEIDAFQLAERCMVAWESYTKKNTAIENLPRAVQRRLRQNCKGERHD